MRHATASTLLTILAGATMTTYSAPATAETEYVAIVIDRTGSMLAVDPSDTAGHNYFQNAQYAAQSIVAAYQTPEPGNTRAFAVYTFGYDQLNEEDGRNGLYRVYPNFTTAIPCAELEPGPVAPPSTTPLGTQDMNNANFCLLSSEDEATNTALLNKLIEHVIMRISWPPSVYVLTPLAAALCEAMSYLRYNTASLMKEIVLESDGGENHTEGECMGPQTLVAADPNQYPDWLLTEDSWQSLSVRRAQWLDRDVKNTSGPTLGWNNPFDHNRWLPLSPTVDPEVLLHWTVDAHFQFISSLTAASPSAALPVPSGPVTDVALTQLSRKATTSPASALTSSVPSMGTMDYAFFKALGTSTPKSQFREIAHMPGTVYGKDHAVPGDVDDNSCTDQSDLAILLGKNVLWQRAVEPNELAIAADLTRDGWVNLDDRDYLLQNWGAGCVNPIPPPQYPGSPWTDCSETTARDMGTHGNNVTVSNDRCLMVRDHYPSWWGIRSMFLQNPSPGAYPVPFSWYSSCSKGRGTGVFTGDWQIQYLVPTSSACATLIKLQGEGNGPVMLRYYAANLLGSCGDNIIQDGEECDDGNAASGDGCSSSCQWEDCSDGVRDNVESDVDCGGMCLLGCVVSQHCNVNADCRSNRCLSNVCVSTAPPTCTVDRATDLGAAGHETTVTTNACVRVRDQYPSWWGTRPMSLQNTTPGNYPVPFSWTNTCAGGSGAGTFTGDWQAKTLDKTSRSCATLISLQGSGSGTIRLRYYGQ